MKAATLILNGYKKYLHDSVSAGSGNAFLHLKYAGFPELLSKKNRVEKVMAGHNYLHQCEFDSHCPNPRVKIVDELKPWQIYPLPVFEVSDHDLSFHVRVNM